MKYKDYAERSRELSKMATPGPWHTRPRDGDQNARGGQVIESVPGTGNIGFAFDDTKGRDAALIVHNRHAADVWREAFLELAAFYCASDRYGNEHAKEYFDRAYAKVRTDG